MKIELANRRLQQALLAGLLLSGGLTAQTSVFAAPPSTDLRGFQTTLKNQGSRNSCITFSSTAALEAAYNRAGYGELDLSEEFFQYMNKVFWLYKWPDQRNKQADDQETQLGFSAGGSGADYLGMVANGLRIPEEHIWPYQTAGYSPSIYPEVGIAYNSPYWAKQKTKSDFNLQAGILDKSHLTADKYYTGTGFTKIRGKPDDMMRQIEDQLAANREVVVDLPFEYTTRFPNDRERLLLDACPNCEPARGHSVLFVGYDRSSADPREHYFIVKNSWGPDSQGNLHPTVRSDGFTYLSYAMVRDNIYSASYITGVVKPAPWPELANVGRWETKLGGWPGTLDIYHVPGVMKQPFDNQGSDMEDRRIGTFYDHKGQAYRVNGIMQGRDMTMWIDKNMPHTPYDRLTGTRYTMHRLHGEDLSVGRFTNPANQTYAGYMMRKNSFAFNEPPANREPVPQDMVGQWNVTYGTNALRTAPFCISSVSSVGAIRGRGSYVISGNILPGEYGLHFRIRGLVNNSGYIDAHRMSWQADVATGTSFWDSGRARGGVIMSKVSDRCD